MTGDPNFDSVVLHLPFDGPDTSTTFNDRSNSRKAVTVFGNAKISTTQSKFNGASAFFDGVDDYLSTPDHADFDFASGDFTIKFWGYALTKGGASSAIIIGQADALGATSASWTVNTDGTRINVTATTGGGTWNIINLVTTGVTPSTAAWKHYAIVKSSGTVTIYVDGVANASASCGTMPDSAFALTVGRGTVSGNSLSGYIDDLQVVKGIAEYTSNFTPPTEPNPIGLTTVLDVDYSSVSLLLNADGSTIVDESPTPKTLTTNGNAALTKVDSKAGTGSLLFDGAGDYLTTPADVGFQFGSGDFTIEFWVKQLSRTTGEYDCLFALDPGTTAFSTALALFAGAGASGHSLLIANTGKTAWAVNLSLGSLPTLSSWNHYAVVRNGANIYVYINGTQVATAGISQAINTLTAGVYVGYALSADSYTHGYVDLLRITKGVARYTGAFTPPNYVLASYSPTATQRALTLTGHQPSIPTAFTGTVTQRSLSLSGLQPVISVAFTGAATQQPLTLLGLQPALVAPVPFTGAATQLALSIVGQTPATSFTQTGFAGIVGGPFETLPVIQAKEFPTIYATGGMFDTTPEILGGATVVGYGFASAPSILFATENTGYVTGCGFSTALSINGVSDVNTFVSGQGFKSTPQILGGGVVHGSGFKSTLVVQAEIPSSAVVVGGGFISAPNIEVVAISSAIVIGGSFISGLAYSKIMGRGFASQPIIKTAFTAEYAKAYVMNVLTGAVSRYENYPFMSLARVGNSYYGFGADGLYELTGDTDIEDDVNGTIKTNDEDLDAFNSRNIPYMYLNGEDDYSVTAVVDEVAQPTFTSGFGGRRVRLARGSKGRYWYFEISGIKHLQGLEYTPDRLTRKVK